MRRHAPILPLVACLTVGLAGCDVANTLDVLPGLKNVRLNSQQQTIANQLITDVVANVQAATDLDLAALYTASGGTAGYRITHATPNKEAEQKRENQLKERVKQQFAKQRGNMKTTAVSTASVTVDGVDCVATTTQLQFTRGGVTQSHTVIRTVDPDGDLVKLVGDMTRSFKNGMAFKAHRERTNAADGSYTALFHSETTFKGKSRIVDWTRTGTADGTETGTGTIQRADGSKVTITITRTAEGVTVTKTEDTSAKVGVEVSQTDDSTEVSATIIDGTSGTAAGTMTVDSEATEPAAE
ncbi:MAG TPA: hypothetical protein V6D05_16810 [Stenomitos sp.]